MVKRDSEHREQITEEFDGFRRDLERLVTKMYTDHFTDDLKTSPEYKGVVASIGRLQEIALEKYKP